MTASTPRERIESLKAGLISALALGLGFGLIATFHELLRRSPAALLAPLLPSYSSGTEGLVSGAIALLSGFLFGITYRYIIRTDNNPHLKSGAIAAFGLTRGLSQVDTGVMLHGEYWSLVLLAGESLVLVAIAQITLDVALHQQWLQPFGASIPTAPGGQRPSAKA